MQLVEKHIIKKSHASYKEIDQICFLSKNLYNRANYIIRQEFINTSREKEAGKRDKAHWIRYKELQKMLQDNHDADYEALPRKVSQWVLKQLDQNWKSFFQAIKEWKNNPDSFTGRPCLPRYKNKTKGRNLLIYTIQAIHQRELKKNILRPSGTMLNQKILHNTIQQARIVPMRNSNYKIEVIYEKEPEPRDLNPKLIASIDINVDNLAAVTSNHREFTPLLINGRPLKNINQHFNKRKAELVSELMKMDKDRRSSRRIENFTFKRNCKTDDYMHKASRFLIDYLSSFGIGTLIIGKNKYWKQQSNMGKRNNQTFVSIPFARFIEMLQYKAELIGMNVIIQEESYTSKCSFLDREPVKKHEKYMGRRIKRGLFKSSNSTLINADVNGSCNIAVKAIPNAFADGIEGVVVRPVRITIPISGKLEVNRNAHKLAA